MRRLMQALRQWWKGGPEAPVPLVEKEPVPLDVAALDLAFVAGLPRFDFNYVSQLPEAPGVYLCLGEHDEILYVGQSKNIRKRWWQEGWNNGKEYIKVHNHFLKLLDMHCTWIAVALLPVEALAIMESIMIRRLRPVLNQKIPTIRSVKIPRQHAERY